MYEVLRRTVSEETGIDASIVLPVFNAKGDALDHRLTELLDGAGPNIELVVVDDASRDGTRAQLLNRLDGARNITLLGATENGGVAAARNAAVACAVGEYVWFVDWDDEWFSHSLPRLLEVAHREDADIVVSQAEAIEAGGTRRVDGLDDAVTLTGPQAFDMLLAGRIAGYLWSKLIRRSLLGTDPFPLLSYQSDLGGFAPVLSGAARVVTVPEVLYRHMIRDGSVSRSSTTDVTCKLACRDILVQTANELPADERRTRLLHRFIFRRVYLGAMNTATRLANLSSDADGAIARIRSEFSWGDLARHLRVDPRTALRLSLVKAAGPNYARLSRALRGMRRRGTRRAGTRLHRLRVLHVARPEDDTTSYVNLITVDAAQDAVEHRIFSWKKAMRLEFDVLHIHWPERMIRGRTPLHRVAKRLATRALLMRMRRHRLPIVRTLHNIAPHERGPRGEERLLRRIDRATTTFVALNRWTPIPDAEAATSTVIPHPHYRDFHPTDPEASAVPGRLLYFGLIRDYKGIDALLGAFASLDDTDASLRIVGSATPHWRETIERAVALDRRVSARLEYVADDELAAEVQRAQAVVFPYRKMHNSGAAFAALSQSRPVLIPANEVNADLVDEVGEQWAMTFDGDVAADDLRRVLSKSGTSAGRGDVPLGARAAQTVSRDYVRVYREALERRAS